MAKTDSAEPEITTKDGLLWAEGKVIGLPWADIIAQKHGFPYAEQMVKALEKQAAELGG